MKPNLTFSKLFSGAIITLLSIAVIGTSCKKSGADVKPSSGNTVNEQKLGATNNIVDASGSDEENFDMVMGKGDYADVSDAASNAVSTTLSNAKSSGRTITYAPSKDVYPYTKTIDYGLGFTDAKGVTRSGKVIITYYDPTKDFFGKYSVTTYDNFYVDGIHVEGTAQINKTKSLNGKDVYVHLIHKTVSNADGDVKDYYAGATWTVIDWNGGTNNAYEISLATTVGTETYNGVESNGFATYVDDAHPVILPIGCKRVQGVVIADIHLAGVPLGDLIQLQERIDYGTGDCDNTATLSINGSEPETVTLPLRFWPLNL